MSSVSVEVADVHAATMEEIARWRALASAVVEDLGATRPVELSLAFVAPDEIAALHEQHLGLPGPTDVLSFPVDGDPREAPGATDPAIPVLLGDVVICLDEARRNALEHGRSFEDEVALLVVHGVLHLLGHDHAEDSDAQVMRAEETALLQRFW